MNGIFVDDWPSLHGAHVEIWRKGSFICTGTVDAVTQDGAILWLWSPANGRRLYEKAGLFEAWAAEERIGFHYQVSRHNSEAVD